MHIAENFLIGTDHENTQQIILTLAQFMHRQTGLDTLLIHVMANLAIGIAGQILQHRTAHRLFIQTVQRHDRQYLINRPGIRQTLEYREVADVLVGHLVIQLVQNLPMRALTRF